MLLSRISRFIFFVADLVLKLLNRNVDVNCRDRGGRPPLWYAFNDITYFSSSREDTISCLLTKIPAYCALVELLLLRGAEPLLLCCPVQRYKTRPFVFVSSIFDYVVFGRFPITTPVILNALKQYIDSCLEAGIFDWSILYTNLRQLMGGDLNRFEQFKIMFPIKNKMILTPCSDDPADSKLVLMEAAATKGDLNVVKYLQQEFKVPVRVANKISSCNPLDYAILHDQDEVVSYLLSIGVRPNKMCLAEITQTHNPKASIIDKVTAYTRSPISLFALSKLNLFETYDNSELNEILPEIIMNQLK